jgi:hypothetical protein
MNPTPGCGERADEHVVVERLSAGALMCLIFLDVTTT